MGFKKKKKKVLCAFQNQLLSGFSLMSLKLNLKKKKTLISLKKHCEIFSLHSTFLSTNIYIFFFQDLFLNSDNPEGIEK